MIDGKGLLIHPNGDIHEGDFKNGIFQGKGKCLFADGNIYEGDFKNDVLLTINQKSSRAMLLDFGCFGHDLQKQIFMDAVESKFKSEKPKGIIKAIKSYFNSTKANSNKKILQFAINLYGNETGVFYTDKDQIVQHQTIFNDIEKLVEKNKGKGVNELLISCFVCHGKQCLDKESVVTYNGKAISLQNALIKLCKKHGIEKLKIYASKEGASSIVRPNCNPLRTSGELARWKALIQVMDRAMLRLLERA